MTNTPFDNNYNNIDYIEMDGNIPPINSNDGHSPPQLNPTVPGHGSGSRHNIGEGQDDGADSDDGMGAWGNESRCVTDQDEENASIDGNASVCGDEGPEEHLIDVGDLGMVPLRDIRNSLAKHSKRCLYRGGIWLVNDDYSPGNVITPSDSGHLSLASSLVVELGSPDWSVATSTPSLTSRTTSSSDLVAFAMQDDAPTFYATPAGFDHPPLWLVPTIERAFFYPATIDENDFN